MEISKNKNQNKDTLFSDIRSLIDSSKQHLAIAINETITSLYWEIGSRINTYILKNKRAEYGKEIVNKLATNLTQEYGKGWSEKHLRHCLRFAETFPDTEIVSALQRQLTWTHIKAILYIDDELKREFYIEM